MTSEPEAQCDGRHPHVRHDGTTIYLYDLVTHPGCPHQPWAAPEGDALRGYADARKRLAGSLRETSSLLNEIHPEGTILGDLASCVAEQFERPVPIALDPPYQRPVLPRGCYDASFGRVHVRPDCRC